MTRVENATNSKSEFVSENFGVIEIILQLRQEKKLPLEKIG